MARHSTDLQPGVMQVRIMLMGPTAEGQASAANIILGQEAFPDSETQRSERHDGIVAGRHLAVITTANLLHFDLSEEEHIQGVWRCLGLSDPGPHVFLWVQQEQKITQEAWDALRRFKESFGEEASRYSMVMFMHEDQEEYVSVGDSGGAGDAALQDFIEDCGGRYHFHSQRNQTQVTELLEKIQEIVEENGNSYFTGEVFEWPDIAWKGLKGQKKEVDSREDLEGEVNSEKVSFGRSSSDFKHSDYMRTQGKVSRPRHRTQRFSLRRDKRDCLKMVLVGRTGVGKSATGNTILGREAFASKAQMDSVTKKCQKEFGIIAGRRVAVIDTPGLFDTTLSTEDVQQAIMKCMGLASPGPHVFFLVISVGRFTQEESETLRLIKMTFGDKAEKYTMVLFNRGDDLGDQSIEEYIARGRTEIKQLIENCGGRYHVLNNREKKDRQQVIDLFKKLEKMNWDNGGTCYTCEMFLEAEKAMIRMQIWKEKEEDVKRQLEMLEAKHRLEIEQLRREKQERKNNMNELQREKDKLMQQEGKERAVRRDQGEEQEDLLRGLTLLERKTGDEEGMEGASGKLRPDQHVKGGQEDEEEERTEHDKEGSEKQVAIKEGKGRKGGKILNAFKMPFIRHEKNTKSPQRMKQRKKIDENDGKKKKRNKKNRADKEPEKTVNERDPAIPSDAESQGGEVGPFTEQRDLEKRRGEKEEQEDEDSAVEKNEALSLTRAEHARLINEMKKYQEMAKQHAKEFETFIRKYSNNFEAVQKNKENTCIIQ